MTSATETADRGRDWIAGLSFTATGQVTGVLVAAGSKVTKGQALARITSAALAASVADAQVTVASAENRLSSDTTVGSRSGRSLPSVTARSS